MLTYVINFCPDVQYDTVYYPAQMTLSHTHFIPYKKKLIATTHLYKACFPLARCCYQTSVVERLKAPMRVIKNEGACAKDSSRKK